MKKIVSFLFIFQVFFHLNHYSQYGAAQFPSADSVGNFLKGSWKWYKSCGGLSSSCITATTTGSYPKSFSFNKILGWQDSITYVYKTNGTITATGASKITNTVLANPTQTVWFLVMYSAPIPAKLRLTSAKKDSVSFYLENCADCYEEFYVRDTTLGGTGVGIKTINDSNIQVVLYPNPVKDLLKIDIGIATEIKQCFMYDPLGQLQNVNLGQDHVISTDGLSPGIYLLYLQTDRGDYRAKLIKE